MSATWDSTCVPLSSWTFGGDLPDLGFVVGVEPPALVVAVGEVDAPGVGRWAAI